MMSMNERRENEVRMYGMTETRLRESVENSITFKLSGPVMLAMSYMSDAQEVVGYGGGAAAVEEARKFLNCAKWILGEYCMTERV